MYKKDETRRYFQIISENLQEIRTLLKESEKLHSDKQTRGFFERCVEKIGEAIKRSGIKNPHFKIFKDIRNEIVHEFDITIHEVISKIQKNLDSFQEFVEEYRSSIFSENAKLKNFEKFSTIGEIAERQKLVDAISSELTEIEDFQISFPKSLGNFSKAIQKTLQHTGLLKLTRENKTLATQVTEEVIEWVETSYKQIQKENPYFEEEKFFEEVKNLSPNEFAHRHKEIFDKLSEIYPKGEIQFSFFEKKLKELKKNFDLNQAELLKNNFLKDWERELQKKKEAYEEKQLEKLSEDFQKELYQKVENFENLKKLLSPFTKDLARLWDLSKGVWQTTGFEILGRYAEVLEKEESIQKLAEMLGRYRKARTNFALY